MQRIILGSFFGRLSELKYFQIDTLETLATALTF